MFHSLNRLLLSLCSVAMLATSAFAQSAGETQSAAAPASPADNGTTSRQPGETASANLGHGTEAQAEHSAEATAHKTLNDPNNQLGTSLQGRTRPVAGADKGSQKDAASNSGADAR